MSRDFHYNPCTFDIPTFSNLRSQWKNIPFLRLQKVIIIEHQYLYFHLFMINNTQHTHVGTTPDVNTWGLGSGVRAGALKAALLMYASIVEGVLLAHALKRKYKLAKNPKKRTFGNILQAWKNDVNGKIELDAILTQLESLSNIRNHIHLEKISSSEEDFFASILDQENKLLDDCERVIKLLQEIS